MSATLSTIETIVRTLLEDWSHDMIPGDIFTYEASSIFTLTENQVIAVTNVLINDSPLGASEYSFDSDTNKVTITRSCLAGDTIEIQYTYYPNYSSTILKNFIKGALTHISINGYKDFVVDPDDDEIYPDPTLNEKNLIAAVSAILINKPINSFRLPDMTINYPVDMPTDKKISRTIAVFKKTQGHGVFSVGEDED